jgi:thioester reductase-like protein
MPDQGGVLLTGATGLLGRYLLRDLLKARPLAVLVRDSDEQTASERIAEIVAFWSEHLRQRLPIPQVIAGDLSHVGLGMTPADRRWLGRRCQKVIHSAANLSFYCTMDREPWKSNVQGTEALIKFCLDIGLEEFHYVSTAFVCGRRVGNIAEEESDVSQSFRNPYEESKYNAEQLIRGTAGIRATVYRPAVIVGDSRTGYASNFTGFYRFLELGVRLANLNASAAGKGFLPIRLPLSGEEMWNLVPVNWVARAIVELLGKPAWHGRTFHLVSKSPVSSRLVRDVAAEVLDIQGVEFTGPEGIANPSRLEQMFLEGIQEYWPYFGGNPVFDCTNTRGALPDLPSPNIDRPMLERLIRFAAANHWARAPRKKVQPSVTSPCADYIENVFPNQARGRGWHTKPGLTLRSASMCEDRAEDSGHARGSRAN